MAVAAVPFYALHIIVTTFVWIIVALYAWSAVDTLLNDIPNAIK